MYTDFYWPNTQILQTTKSMKKEQTCKILLCFAGENSNNVTVIFIQTCHIQ